MKVLDLFCGAGGAAMGLHRAWPDAEIVGVDIKPQPRYPFTFVQADAMTFPLDGYDFIWASPPCQGYSVTNNIWKKEYPRLIDGTRRRLLGHRYIMENVVGAPLVNPIRLCGMMFGLRVYRHRLFESSDLLVQPPHPKHSAKASYGHRSRPGDFITVSGHFSDMVAAKEAMGIDWMPKPELAQAIPPAYSEFIARQLLINSATELVA